MSIWTALLLHGGYVAATPIAVRLVAPELLAAPTAPPYDHLSAAAAAAATPPELPIRPPWARVAVDYLLLR
jgi:hypothetical protein